VVVGHGLVLVPFILIAPAALIGRQLAATLTLAGTAVLAIRTWLIRR
jgi:hypothetical protein